MYVCGVKLKNVYDIAGQIGLKSVHIIRQILECLKSVLTSRESSLLNDNFPGMCVFPKIDERESSFLLSSDQIAMVVIATGGKAIYGG